MKINLSPLGVMNFFFMLGISFVLTFDSNLFSEESRSIQMYRFYLDVSPQEGYGIASFLFACILFTAFVFRNITLEIVGLGFSGILTIFILSGYLITFPNLGSVAFAVWSLATFMTIVDLLYIRQDRMDRRRRIVNELKKLADDKQVLIGREIHYNEIDRYERILQDQEKDDLEKARLFEEEAERVRNEVRRRKKEL